MYGINDSTKEAAAVLHSHSQSINHSVTRSDTHTSISMTKNRWLFSTTYGRMGEWLAGGSEGCDGTIPRSSLEG
jgi:hypothetical protein